MRHISISGPYRFAFVLLLALPLLAQPAPTPAASPLTDPAAYLAQQFGPTFKIDPKLPPMFGDFDGDGREDVVLVATSATPMLSQEQFHFKAADPYDAYFGNGNPVITSQFSLHFDGSSRCILIVFDWRQTPGKPSPKFVLINTPFESAGITNLQLKKKKKGFNAIEVIDRTTLHALIFWNGRRWIWSAQGMEGDDSFKMPPPDDPIKLPPVK